MSESPRKGECVTVEITDLNNLGCGVGHLADGRVVFVAGAVAGDTVTAELIKINKTYTVARLMEILTPSPEREEGFCGAPAACGGCVYRNLTYKRELELKREGLIHTFRKAGLPDAEILPVRTTGEVRGYRNKAEYPIAVGKNGLYGGFYAQKTHHVIGYFDCALQPPVFAEILRETCVFFTARGVSAYNEQTGTGLLRHLYLRDGRGSGEIFVCPVLNGERLPDEAEYVALLRKKFPRVAGICVNINRENTNLVLGTEYRTLWGKPYLTDRLCGLEIGIAPGAFYQVNHDAAELLYGIAAEQAELTGGELLLDLYCGAGTIGLSMAHRVREVLGIEIVPAAVENAAQNAARNGVKNATFYCGDAGKAETLLAAAEAECGTLHPDVVILDPPRKGCDAALLDFLAARKIPRIVYISCGPAALARDAAHLLSLGYAMSPVTPVDLFPRTGHVECVTTFRRIAEHSMRLSPEPFAQIQNGTKTIELRLFDEKRQGICIGDRIVFTHTKDPAQKLTATVKKLHCFGTFEELYRALPPERFGYAPEAVSTASAVDMELYYSVEEQARFGVVGIEIALLQETSAVLRQATLADADAVFALYRSVIGSEFCVWNEEYPGMQEITEDIAAGSLCLKKEQGELIGAISVVPQNELDEFPVWRCADGTAREIARVAVALSHRGKGVAGEMVTQITEILRGQGCRALHLSVAKCNAPALRVYEKQGFSVAGEAQLYGEAYYLMEKLL